MTLQVTPGPLQYEVDAPPHGGIEAVKFWAHEMFRRLVQLQQEPRVQSVAWARVELASDPVMQRPAEGMVILAAPDVVAVGKPQGLYLYLGGIWKQLQTV